MAMDPARVAADAIARLKSPSDPFVSSAQEASTLAAMEDILGAMVYEVETYYTGGGGTSDHSLLTSLAWTSSGHTGTATRLAGFNGSGAASEYQVSATPGVGVVAQGDGSGTLDSWVSYRPGGTDVAVADGGTGSSTAAGARTNLGLAIGSNVQAWDANLDQLAALTPTASYFITGNGSAWVASSPASSRTALGLGDMATQSSSSVSITGGSVSGITDLAVADGGTGSSTAAGARTNLGLGTIATQSAASVAITGGSITGITDLAVADGGTGSSTAAGARTNLGVAIGSDVQAHSSQLDTIAGLTPTANYFMVANGSTWTAMYPPTARTALGLGSMATQGSTGVSISGGDVSGLTSLGVVGTGLADLELTVGKGASWSSSLAFQVAGVTVASVVCNGSEELGLYNVTSNADVWASVNYGGVQKEMWRIDAANFRMGIGTPTPTAFFHVAQSQTNYVAIIENTNTSTLSDGLRLVLGAATPGTSAYYLEFFSGTGNAGEVAASGATGVTYATTSDRRLKTSITPAGGMLAAVRALEPVTYEWRAAPGSTELGLIAQDVAQVAPEAVINTDARNEARGLQPGDEGWSPWSVDYGRLTPRLVGAVRELADALDAANRRADEAEARLARLEAVVAALAHQ